MVFDSSVYSLRFGSRGCKCIGQKGKGRKNSEAVLKPVFTVFTVADQCDFSQICGTEFGPGVSPDIKMIGVPSEIFMTNPKNISIFFVSHNFTPKK